MKFPIPQDWDGSSWCRWSVCWPDSEHWAGFLRGLLTLPQRGWTWDERTGSILDIQAIGREISAQNLPLDGVIMSCNDTLLADAFNNIAIAIGNLGSGGSQGQCCGTIQGAVDNSLQGFVPSLGDGSSVPVWGSVPPVVLPPSGIPDGFETIEEYQVNKCALAHQTVDGVAGTLRGLGAITVFNIITLAGLVLVAIASSIAFPPAAIPALLAAMLLLTGGLAVLVTMGDLITEHRDELICVLYESDTVELMVQGVEAIMTTLVALLPVSGALALVVKSITMMFFNTDTLNGLMSNVAALGYPDADCTGCGCQELQVDLSTREFLASYTWPGVITYTSVGSNSSNMVDTALNLSNPTKPNSRGVYRFVIDNPDNRSFGRIVMPIEVGVCCNVFFSVLLVDDLGEISNPFSSNAFAGLTYATAFNFASPVVVKEIIVYCNNSISQGFDWTIDSLLLTCAI